MIPAASQHPALQPSKPRLLSVVLALAFAVLTATVFTHLLAERAEYSPLVRVGQPAPHFTLKPNRGGRVSLTDQRGHPVLLACRLPQRYGNRTALHGAATGASSRLRRHRRCVPPLHPCHSH